MKMLHPSLNKYKPLAVNSKIKKVEFLVSVEHGDSSILPIVAQALEGFIPYHHKLDGYRWDADDVPMTDLGAGCFSTVFEHPTKEGRAIKLFRNYVEDSTCYQYLRLCANKTIEYEWCPNVYSLGRIKIACWNSKTSEWEFRECAYAELDLLLEKCGDSNIYMGEWYDTFQNEVLEVYFPFAGMDLKHDNVLGRITPDGDGIEYFITDPVWNYDQCNYEATHESLKDLYVIPVPYSQGKFINKLREGISHARVW